MGFYLILGLSSLLSWLISHWPMSLMSQSHMTWYTVDSQTVTGHHGHQYYDIWHLARSQYIRWRCDSDLQQIVVRGRHFILQGYILTFLKDLWEEMVPNYLVADEDEIQGILILMYFSCVHSSFDIAWPILIKMLHRHSSVSFIFILHSMLSEYPKLFHILFNKITIKCFHNFTKNFLFWMLNLFWNKTSILTSRRYMVPHGAVAGPLVENYQNEEERDTICVFAESKLVQPCHNK